MATLKTVTLGCRVNQYETELVRQALATAGFQDAQNGEAADLCIVNTCTVTHEGDAKGRQAIRRLAKENPGARMVVMGCYATRAPAEVASLPGVSEVLTDKRELPDLLGRFGVVDLPTGIASFASRRRAYVKVQDGCMLQCSFCIIPAVRPHLASRPVDHIEDEVRRLTDAGHKEIVLTGIHLGHYGVEKNRGKSREEWLRLADLVERLARLDGDFRLRLSSIEATEVTRPLIAAMAAHPQRVCPHLHVSLQSGSDRVLRRMKRRWGVRRFVDRCRLVQASLDLPAFSTDIIVGFPGETEDDFLETCAVADEIGFSKIHVFSYSRRKGTMAAEFADQIPAEVAADRRARLLALETSLRARYFRRLLGRPLQVLLEGPGDRPDSMVGTACRYAQVEVAAPPSLRGQFVVVEPRSLAPDRLLE